MIDRNSVGAVIIVTFRTILFLVGLYYVGYINEYLKLILSVSDRVILLIGFIFGLYNVILYVEGLFLKKRRDPKGQSRPTLQGSSFRKRFRLRKK